MISYDPIRIFYPIFLIVMLLKALLIQRRHRANSSWQETLASLGIAIGHRVTDTVFGIISLSIYSFVRQHRLFAMDLTD